MDDNKDPYLAILELRNTIVSGLDMSPVELLMGRRTRSILPTRTTLLKPKYDNLKIKEQLQNKQRKQKVLFDKSSKSLPDLKPDDVVRIHNEKTETWEPAQVVSKREEPRSFIVRTSHRSYGRNRRDLLKTQEKIQEHCDIELPKRSTDTEFESSSLSPSYPVSAPMATSEAKNINTTPEPRVSKVSERIINPPSRYSE